jgi:Cu/Zn superoxide dismutase
MSGTPLKMGVGSHDREEEHDKSLGKGFCALVGFLFFFLIVIFVSAGSISSLEADLAEEALGYRRGPVARAVFHDARVEGLVSMRASASRPHAPTKVVVGLAFQEAAPRGEYAWSVSSECRAGTGTDLNLRHGMLRNEGALSARVVYDSDLPLAGESTVVGKQLVLSGPDGALTCALIDFTTSDGRPISALAGGTRGAACAGDGGAVASTNYLATRAGLRVLAEGGNAADAAVAVQLMLGVSQPESNGIGGGCFLVFYNATTKEVQTIDGREEAPALFHPNVFCADPECGNDPHCPSCPGGPMGFSERFTGGLAVGVPGTFAAAARLNEEHGTKAMRELAAPAIETARNGITMTNHLYNAIRGSVPRLELWPASAELYLSSNSARAELRPTGRGGDVTGVVTLTDTGAGSVEIEYNIQGLVPLSTHGFRIHETSDYSNGCLSTGGHYNPSGNDVGNLGNVVADRYGVAAGTITNSLVRLTGETSVLGRSFVLHEGTDDLSLGGQTGGRLMCGTIQKKPIADPGENWYNPDLAATYELLSERGASEFYSGDLAREIVAAVQEAVNPVSNRGGVMDYADISGYRAVKRAPTHVHFEGPNEEDYELFGMGMPSSGGATMAMVRSNDSLLISRPLRPSSASDCRLCD